MLKKTVKNWKQIYPAVTQLKHYFDKGLYYPAGEWMGYLSVLLLGQPGETIDYSDSNLVMWILDIEEEIRKKVRDEYSKARRAIHTNIVHPIISTMNILTTAY